MKRKTAIKRDPAVETARIIGCMIVIGVHTCLSAQVNGRYDISRVFISCIVGDGVTVFWLIAGFFCFKNDYGKMLKRTWKNIGIPMITYTLIAFYFYGWLLDGTSLRESLHYPKEQYMIIVKSLLTWNNAFPYCSHLWYLYTYILLAIAFPVLKAFTAYLDEKPETRWKTFFAISMAALVLNDITSNKLFNFSLISTAALVPASIEVIYGFYLYKKKEFFNGPRYVILAPAIFIALNIVRAIIQYHRYQINPENNWLLFWFSSFGVLCAMCVVVFCFSLDHLIDNISVKSIVCRIASYTLLIYLIHPAVISILISKGIIEKVSVTLTKHLNGDLFDVIYTITIIIIVFSASLIIAAIIKALVSLVKDAWENIGQS